MYVCVLCVCVCLYLEVVLDEWAVDHDIHHVLTLLLQGHNQGSRAVRLHTHQKEEDTSRHTLGLTSHHAIEALASMQGWHVSVRQGHVCATHVVLVDLVWSVFG